MVGPVAATGDRLVEPARPFRRPADETAIASAGMPGPAGHRGVHRSRLFPQLVGKGMAIGVAAVADGRHAGGQVSAQMTTNHRRGPGIIHIQLTPATLGIGAARHGQVDVSVHQGRQDGAAGKIHIDRLIHPGRGTYRQKFPATKLQDRPRLRRRTGTVEQPPRAYP